MWGGGRKWNFIQFGVVLEVEDDGVDDGDDDADEFKRLVHHAVLVKAALFGRVFDLLQRPADGRLHQVHAESDRA